MRLGGVAKLFVKSSIVGSLFGVLHFMITVILAVLLSATYSALTEEELIASITFENEDNQTKIYKASVFDAENSKIDDYIIYGDQWRIDAEFIKMKYWANVLGVDSRYTLNRFEGRYKNISEENSMIHKAYQLEDHQLIEYFSFFFDTTYGSSTYQDISLGTKYKVLKTQTGLMVREEPIVVTEKESLLDKTKAFFGMSTK